MGDATSLSASADVVAWSLRLFRGRLAITKNWQASCRHTTLRPPMPLNRFVAPRRLGAPPVAATVTIAPRPGPHSRDLQKAGGRRHRHPRPWPYAGLEVILNTSVQQMATQKPITDSSAARTHQPDVQASKAFAGLAPNKNEPWRLSRLMGRREWAGAQFSVLNIRT